MTARIFLEQERPRGESLRVSISEYKGQYYIDARIWYTDRDGAVRPGRSGVSLRPESIDDVVKALLAAKRALEAEP